jgi:hypothetical protein
MYSGSGSAKAKSSDSGSGSTTLLIWDLVLLFYRYFDINFARESSKSKRKSACVLYKNSSWLGPPFLLTTAEGRGGKSWTQGRTWKPNFRCFLNFFLGSNTTPHSNEQNATVLEMIFMYLKFKLVTCNATIAFLVTSNLRPLNFLTLVAWCHLLYVNFNWGTGTFLVHSVRLIWHMVTC